MSSPPLRPIEQPSRSWLDLIAYVAVHPFSGLVIASTALALAFAHHVADKSFSQPAPCISSPTRGGSP